MYAVTVIIIRGVSLLSGESGSGDVMDLHDLSVGPVVFRHDPRLMLPSLVYFTDEQVKVTVQYMCHCVSLCFICILCSYFLS